MNVPDRKYFQRLIEHIYADSELRSLVDEWLLSGKNWEVFLANRKRKRISVKHLIWGTSRIVLDPLSPKGWTIVTFFKDASPAENEFMNFLLHPMHNALGGPCKCGCGKYFFASGMKKDKAFVSGHTQRFTALAATRRAQKAKREKRVAIASKAMKHYEPRFGDWKDYVSSKTGIHRSALTRWFNNGSISLPKGVAA
jgi:hypothetical protein